MPKITKTIPFDWEFYQANKHKCKLICGGNEVTQLTFFAQTKLPLTGICNGNYEHFFINGLTDFNDSRFNLKIEYTTEVKEAWVNLWEDEDGNRMVDSETSSTKEMAEQKEPFYKNRKRIFIIPLHLIEEGNG